MTTMTTNEILPYVWHHLREVGECVILNAPPDLRSTLRKRGNPERPAHVRTGEYDQADGSLTVWVLDSDWTGQEGSLRYAARAARVTPEWVAKEYAGMAVDDGPLSPRLGLVNAAD